jgi:hypothetical protein
VNNPTNNEDYRVTVARQALIESAEAKGTDRSAYEMWGYLEGTVKSLLDVIDEGAHEARTPDLSTLPRAELIRHILFHCDEARRGVDVLKEREDA